MKYLKLFENFLNESRIPRIRLNGEYYHGSVIQDKEFWYHLNPRHSDWDAVWFSSKENVSEEFAEEAYRDEKTEVKVVFKVNIKCTGIANIDYQLFQQIIDKNELYDPRDYIKTLIEKGFNGWLTSGVIGSTQYDDIAIFNEDCFNVVAVKFYLKDKEKWTDYIPIREAEEFFNQKFNSQEE